MRTTTIELKGKEYILCLSLKGIANLSARYGGLEKASKAMAKPDICDAIIILAEMMSCGDRYAKLNGMENPEPLSQEELEYGLDMADFAPMMAKVGETAQLSMEREVEVSPNPEATAEVSK
nr:MAG TPA: tail assembly chaperone protein [Caudoviricetes sp.]